MTLKTRLGKVENELRGKGWKWEVEQLVKRGLFTPHDVLMDIGNTALQTWPDWYQPITDEHMRIVQESEQRFDAEMVNKLGSQQAYDKLLNRIHENTISHDEILALIA